MKSFVLLSVLTFLLLIACSHSSSPNNLDEAKAKNAVEQFLLQIKRPNYSNTKLLSVGPLIVDGNKRKMSFKWSYRLPELPNTNTVEGSVTFGFAQDGKWYLTDIMYNGGEGLASPNTEVK